MSTHYTRKLSNCPIRFQNVDPKLNLVAQKYSIKIFGFNYLLLKTSLLIFVFYERQLIIFNIC